MNSYELGLGVSIAWDDSKAVILNSEQEHDEGIARVVVL